MYKMWIKYLKKSIKNLKYQVNTTFNLLAPEFYI